MQWLVICHLQHDNQPIMFWCLNMIFVLDSRTIVLRESICGNPQTLANISCENQLRLTHHFTKFHPWNFLRITWQLNACHQPPIEVGLAWSWRGRWLWVTLALEKHAITGYLACFTTQNSFRMSILPSSKLDCGRHLPLRMDGVETSCLSVIRSPAPRKQWVRNTKWYVACAE